jgi:hypothetical protein
MEVFNGNPHPPIQAACEYKHENINVSGQLSACLPEPWTARRQAGCECAYLILYHRITFTVHPYTLFPYSPYFLPSGTLLTPSTTFTLYVGISMENSFL